MWCQTHVQPLLRNIYLRIFAHKKTSEPCFGPFFNPPTIVLTQGQVLCPSTYMQVIDNTKMCC